MKKRKSSIKKKEFTCPSCGYEAYKLGGYLHCPLCIICKGCDQKVGECTCIERE